MQRGEAFEVLVVLEDGRHARERPVTRHGQVKFAYDGVEVRVRAVDARTCRITQLLRRDFASLEPVQQFHDIVITERVIGAHIDADRALLRRLSCHAHGPSPSPARLLRPSAAPTYSDRMTQHRKKIMAVSLLATGMLALAACGGGSSSSETTSAAPAPAPTDSPIGGGAAECTTDALEKATEEAAAAQGIDLLNTNDYDCEDGWAIVFGITKSGDIEQTTAFLFQAEGP